jgi:alpha-glucosidase (family GH31 glycosyl hydrolase)
MKISMTNLLVRLTCVLSTLTRMVFADLGSLEVAGMVRLPSPVAIGEKFLVAWERQGASEEMGSRNDRLVVYSAGYPQRELWSSPWGKAFIGLGTSPQDIEHFYFGFKVTTPKFLSQSTLQTVTSIDEDGASILIRGNVNIQTKSSNGQSQVPYTLRLNEDPKSSYRLQLSVDVDQEAAKQLGINRLELFYSTEKDEEIFGFGEQFPRDFDMKGKRIPILVSEGGLGRGLEPLTFIANNFKDYSGGSEFSTYAPIPHYITSKSRSVFLENYHFSVFDLSDCEHVKIELAAMSLQMQIVYGNSPLELIEHFTDFSGRMQALPEWISSGAVVGTQGGRAFVEDIHAKLRKFDVPIAAYWLQDWVGLRESPWGVALWWNWEVDETRYPNWDEFVQNMSHEDVRVMTYVNSHVGNVDAKEDPPPRRNLFKELTSAGYDVKDKDGKTMISYQQAAMYGEYVVILSRDFFTKTYCF